MQAGKHTVARLPTLARISCPDDFFFQAEDGIRGLYVTGFRRVLFRSAVEQRQEGVEQLHRQVVDAEEAEVLEDARRGGIARAGEARQQHDARRGAAGGHGARYSSPRSEERRVGQEGRSRWWTEHDEQE